MIPWEKIDTAKIPGSDEELRLMRRGKEFLHQARHNELMNSRLSGSEGCACDARGEADRGGRKARCSHRWPCMGFTLRAALAVLGSNAKIVVVRARAGRSSPGREARWHRSSATVSMIPG